MRRNKRKMSIFLILSICMTLCVGCSNQIYMKDEEESEPIDVNELMNSYQTEAESDAKELLQEVESTVQVVSDESSLEGQTDGEESSEEPELEPLHFEDVFGNQFDTFVDPGVVKHDYNKPLFVRNGNKMTYDDDAYSSRLGIDVSYYNGSIDWNQVKADGYEFVFIRVGNRGYGQSGSLNEDTQFKSNLKGAKDAGLDVGVYFFSQAITEEEAREEAEFVLQRISDYSLEMPVVFDPEHIDGDTARTDDVTGEQFTKNAVMFLKTIKEAGYDAMLYTNMSWEAFEFDLKEVADYPIWYADYLGKEPQTPYNFEIWQYTNKASVAGISGNCDVNIQLIRK